MKLDLAAPMRSLRAAAGLTQAAAAAARGIAAPTQAQAEARGARVQLDTLLEAADALGLEIEVKVRKRGSFEK